MPTYFRQNTQQEIITQSFTRHRFHLVRVVKISLLAMLGVLLSPDYACAAGDTNSASVRPLIATPPMAQAPDIDGKMADGEWNTASVYRFVGQNSTPKDMLNPREGMFAVGADDENLYIAVRTAVHPTAGIVAAHEPTGKKDVGDVIYDDSIELWVDNDPSRGGGKFYQILVNSQGVSLTKMHDRTDGSANLWWDLDAMKQAHEVKDGIWTAEFAIPLKDLEIADPGKEIGLRVCRNYKHPWDQSRWAPGVNAFDSAETMGRFRSLAAAPVVKEIGLQDENGIAVQISVSNPGEAPLPVKVRLGYNAEQQPRYYENWDEVLQPKESKTFTYRKEFFSPDNYPAVAEILVTSPDGTPYHHRDVKWLTLPGDPWEKVAVADKNEAFDFAIEWHPTPKLLRWRADYSGFTEKDDVTGLRLVIRPEEGGAPVAETQVAAPDAAEIEQRWELPQLPDGRFVVELYPETKNGTDEKPVKSLVFVQKSDFPWLNQRIGISDEVIPPFTPIKTEGDSLECILRKYTFADTGLWKSVIADGDEILAAPMRFEVRQGGKLLEVKGTFDFTEKKPNQVQSKAAFTAGGLTGKTVGVVDYDGCMKVTLELSQTDQEPIESLDLVIPLKNEFAPLMHACGDGLRINFAGEVPSGEGEVWSSIRASRSDLIGTFLPYLWVGEETRGMTWFAANDRGWTVDTTDKTPALSLERDGETLNLRVRFIQKPTVIDKPREIVFGLMATPAKPMPDGWRLVGLSGGGKKEVTLLGMNMYWGGLMYGVFPMERDFTVVQKITDGAKDLSKDPAFFEEYKKKYPEIAPEINWAANMRGADYVIPYTNLRGANTFTPEWLVYQDEWRRGNFSFRWTDPTQKSGAIDFSIIPVPSNIDFLLYYYREFLNSGMDGIYWDNICIYSNSNRVTSEGYIREDGLFQPEADIWRLRDVTRRTAVLAHELGKGNWNMPHMTNSALVPVFSWTKIFFDWEWKYGETDWQERFSRAYIRSTSIGRQTGNIPTALEGHTNHITDPQRQAWVLRTRTGVALTHEIIIHQADPYLNKLRETMFEMGYGTDQCEVFNYWDRNPVIKVSGMESSWIVLNGAEEVMIILCDWDNGSSDVQIEAIGKELGLPEDFVATNLEDPSKTYQAKAGKLSLGPIKKHDFIAVRIKK